MQTTGPPDEAQKAVLDLGRKVNVRSLKIQIVERRPGTAARGQIGFSEVELLLEN